MNVKEELNKARETRCAIGAFNTNNLEVTKAICSAAKKLDATILIQTTPSALEYAGPQTLFDIIRDEIDSSGINAAIHLDHAKDFETVKRCIDMGYKSVMFDGSKLSFDENVAETKKVVEYAHERGVTVEAEIGVIGKEEGGQISGTAVMSDPDQVAKFVELTGVDSVAVSVGNEHGAPEGEKVDLKLLKLISEKVSIPLVMHGSSGLCDEDIRAAIGCGVTKFNVDTKLKHAFAEAIESSSDEDYRDANKEGMDAVGKVVEERIKLLQNS
ncbi:MAG: class II fructose-bisphosphate aldolase [Candidatus Berkelbacteria bacterium]